MPAPLRIGDGFAVLKAPNGAFVSVPVDDAEQVARDSGYQIAPRAEAEAENERRRFSDETGQAALERAVRGVTFGAVEGVNPSEDSETTRRRAQVFKEEHPLLEGAVGIGSELAVDVAAGALTGGLGAGATRAARAARAGGAVLGDVLAATSAEREAAYQAQRDADLSSAIAFGVGGGLLARGAVKTAGRLLGRGSRGARSAADTAAARSLDEEAEVIADAVPTGRGVGAETVGDADSALQASKRLFDQASDSAAAARAPDAWAAARGAVDVDDLQAASLQARNRESILRNATDRLKRGFDDARDARDALASPKNKLKIARSKVPTDEASEALQRSGAAATGNGFDRVVANLETLAKENKGASGLPQAVRGLKSLAKTELGDAVRKGGAEGYVALDNIKRALQHMHQAIGQRATDSANPMRGIHEAALEMIDELEKPLREFLENSAAWGEMAADQIAINRNWHDDFIPNAYLTGRQLFSDVAMDYERRKTFAADTGKISSMLRQGRIHAEDELWKQLERRLDADEKLAQEARRLGRPQGDIDRLQASISKMREALRVAENNRVLSERWANRAPTEGLVDKLADAAGTVPGIGPIASRAIGFAATAADTMQDRSRRAARAAVRGRADRSRAQPWRPRRRSAAGSVAGGTGATFGASVAGNLAAGAGDGAPSTSTALLQGESPSIRSGFEEHSDLVRSLTTDPAAFAERMAESYPGLYQQAPILYSRMAERLSEALAYLAEHLPARGGGGIQNPDGAPATDSEIRTYALRFSAALYPETAIASVEDGTVDPAQIDALKRVHPERYTALRLDVLEELQAAAGGAPIDPSRKALLSTLFELPGAAGRIYEPSFGVLMNEIQNRNAANGSAAPRADMAPSETMPQISPGIVAGPTRVGG